MTPRNIILAIASLVIGFSIGLPLGALRSGTHQSSHASDRSDASDSSDQSDTAKSKLTTAISLTLAAKLERLFSEREGGSWSRVDEKAAAALESLDTPSLRALALEVLVKADTASEVVRSVFMHWAARDAESAWQAAVSATSKQRAQALIGCLRAICATDYFAALKRAEAFPDAKLRDTLVDGVKADASRFWNAEKVARSVLALPEKDRPDKLVGEALRSWMIKDYNAALSFTQSLPPADRDAALPEFCQTLVYFDTEAATKLAATIQDKKLVSMMIGSEIMSRWAEADPRALLRWLESAQGTLGEKKTLVEFGLAMIADKDPALALEAVSKGEARVSNASGCSAGIFHGLWQRRTASWL